MLRFFNSTPSRLLSIFLLAFGDLKTQVALVIYRPVATLQFGVITVRKLSSGKQTEILLKGGLILIKEGVCFGCFL